MNQREPSQRGLFFGVPTFFLMLLALPVFAQAVLSGNEPITPLPSLQSLNLDERKVKLGDSLFNDVRLSENNSISCSSCHQIGLGGADGRKTSVGIYGQIGPINAPTVLNSGFNFRQFWDGRAKSLEDQIDGVVHNPKEFASKWPEIIDKLRKDTSMLGRFRELYPDGLTEKNAKNAIATFERSLVTPSRFDRFLLGDEKAISIEEGKGYQLFKQYGCVACHQGVNVGGNMYQKFGVFSRYFEKRGDITPADGGRFNVTNREEDRHVFKVPSLRNVALTAPYFHDASAATLDEAVNVMFINQIGRVAPEENRRLIVKFLQSLTGERFSTQK
jgi:cytochrome c peroxidase